MGLSFFKFIKKISWLIELGILIIQALILFRQQSILENQFSLSMHNSKQSQENIFVIQQIKCFNEICEIIAFILVPDNDNIYTEKKLTRIALKNQYFIPREAYEEINNIIKELKNNNQKDKLNKKILDHFIKMQDYFLEDIESKLKYCTR